MGVGGGVQEIAREIQVCHQGGTNAWEGQGEMHERERARARERERERAREREREIEREREREREREMHGVQRRCGIGSYAFRKATLPLVLVSLSAASVALGLLNSP